MPGFLRRKATDTKSSAAQAQSTPTKGQNLSSSSGEDAPPTPLYARFASTATSTTTTATTPQKPIVSGPMMLTSRRTAQESASVSQGSPNRRQNAQYGVTPSVSSPERRVPNTYAVPTHTTNSATNEMSNNRSISPLTQQQTPRRTAGPPASAQLASASNHQTGNGHASPSQPIIRQQQPQQRSGVLPKREDKPLPQIHPDPSQPPPPSSFASQQRPVVSNPMNMNGVAHAQPQRSASHRLPQQQEPPPQQQPKRFSLMSRANQSSTSVDMPHSRNASDSNGGGSSRPVLQNRLSKAQPKPNPVSSNVSPPRAYGSSQPIQENGHMGMENILNAAGSIQRVPSRTQIHASPPPNLMDPRTHGNGHTNMNGGSSIQRVPSRTQMHPLPPPNDCAAHGMPPMDSRMLGRQPSRTQMNAPPPSTMQRTRQDQWYVNGQMDQATSQPPPPQQQPPASNSRKPSGVPHSSSGASSSQAGFMSSMNARPRQPQLPQSSPYPNHITPRAASPAPTKLVPASNHPALPKPSSSNGDNALSAQGVSSSQPGPRKGSVKGKPLIFAAMASVESTDFTPPPPSPQPKTLSVYLDNMNASSSSSSMLPSSSMSSSSSVRSRPPSPSRTPTMSNQTPLPPVPPPHTPKMYAQSGLPSQQQQQHEMGNQSQYSLASQSSMNFFQGPATPSRPQTPKSSSAATGAGPASPPQHAQAVARPRKISKASSRSMSQSSSSHHRLSASIDGMSMMSQATSMHEANASGSFMSGKARPTTPNSSKRSPPPATVVDEEVARKAGLPLDDDPFAKMAPVKVVKPPSRDGLPPLPPSREGLPPSRDGLPPSRDGMASLRSNGSSPDPILHPTTPPPKSALKQAIPASPPTPEEYKSHRTRRRGDKLERAAPLELANVTPRGAQPFPLEEFLSNSTLLENLLTYLTYFEWSVLFGLAKRLRSMMSQQEEVREVILERYLRTVGYERWCWKGRDPLILSLKDLNDYMRGVSLPTYQYAQIAQQSVSKSTSHVNLASREMITDSLISATASTRAYTRVVLRLRAQAEAEIEDVNSKKSAQQNGNGYGASPPPPAMKYGGSRAPSPTMSAMSHSQHGHGSRGSPTPGPQHSSAPYTTFRSPLFRPRRAPLLRVFVPSPDGDWLSDASVMQCEEELKRAGVSGLLRVGDVVWDVAVGDEGNLGRMIWDGCYLIDLDYAYSTVGDIPKYIHTLAFPPSYFHRVLRTGTNANPIIHVDISPWGEEIAARLQLLQDRVRTETPQGAYHNVVRWVHRSSFTIRPPAPTKHRHRFHGTHDPAATKIPIPGAPQGTFVDPGWYGTIVVETEGTNEHLADLQERCGPGAFPPRVNAPGRQVGAGRDREALKVFRILREKSRPGEIWIRTVGDRERIN